MLAVWKPMQVISSVLPFEVPSTLNSPLMSEVAHLPLSLFRTMAPGTISPFLSVTTPFTIPCAKSDTFINNAHIALIIILFIIQIFIL